MVTGQRRARAQRPADASFQTRLLTSRHQPALRENASSGRDDQQHLLSRGSKDDRRPLGVASHFHTGLGPRFWKPNNTGFPSTLHRRLSPDCSPQLRAPGACSLARV